MSVFVSKTGFSFKYQNPIKSQNISTEVSTTQATTSTTLQLLRRETKNTFREALQEQFNPDELSEIVTFYYYSCEMKITHSFLLILFYFTWSSIKITDKIV